MGTRLFRQLVTELRRLGYRSMMVQVLKENPATRFYERLGGRAFAEQDVDIRGIRCREVACGWPSLEETG
jgi:hypothetical protein